MFILDAYIVENKACGEMKELLKLRTNQPAIINALLDELFYKIPKGDGITFSRLNKLFEKDPWVNIN